MEKQVEEYLKLPIVDFDFNHFRELIQKVKECYPGDKTVECAFRCFINKETVRFESFEDLDENLRKHFADARSFKIQLIYFRAEHCMKTVSFHVSSFLDSRATVSIEDDSLHWCKGTAHVITEFFNSRKKWWYSILYSPINTVLNFCYYPILFLGSILVFTHKIEIKSETELQVSILFIFYSGLLLLSLIVKNFYPKFTVRLIQESNILKRYNVELMFAVSVLGFIVAVLSYLKLK